MQCPYKSNIIADFPGEEYKELSSSSYPLKVISATADSKDPEIHVLLFDVEELICQLLTEENPLLTGNCCISVPFVPRHTTKSQIMSPLFPSKYWIELNWGFPTSFPRSHFFSPPPKKRRDSGNEVGEYRVRRRLRSHENFAIPQLSGLILAIV